MFWGEITEVVVLLESAGVMARRLAWIDCGSATLLAHTMGRGSLSIVAILASVLSAWPAAAEDPPCIPCVSLLVNIDTAERLAVELSASSLELAVSLDENQGLQGLSRLGALKNSRAGSRLHFIPRLFLADAVRQDVVQRIVKLGAQSVVLTVEADVEPKTAAFRIKRAATALRAVQPAVRIVLEVPDARARVLAAELLGYIDGLLLSLNSQIVPGQGLNLAVWRTVVPLGSAERDPLQFLIRISSGRFERVLLQVNGSEAEVYGRLLRALGSVLPEGLSALETIHLTADQTFSSRVFLHPHTFEAIAILESSEAPRELAVHPAASRITMFSSCVTTEVPITREAGRTVAAVPWPSQSSLIVLRIEGWRVSEPAFSEGIEVKAARSLTVQEIIAKHQVAAARQAAAIQSLIAEGRTMLTFEAPGFPAPFTVTAQTTMFKRGDETDVRQRELTVNGLRFIQGRIPKLPLVEPERVSAAPLTIQLTDAYTYSLSDRVYSLGREAYEVHFEPVDSSQSLFRGAVWISADDFLLVRVNAEQTNLRGPIVVSKQMEEYDRISTSGAVFSLPVRTEMHQIYEGLGRTTPIHRVVTIESYRVNAQDYEQERLAAHRSSDLMLRETPKGLRYLERAPRTEESGERRIDRHGSRSMRSVVGGIIIDPNITFPLPFAGVNFTDFDVAGTGGQLSGFFGGTFGRLTWTQPAAGGTRWTVDAQAFGVLARYHDRSFRDGVEQYQENIRQRPAQAAVGFARNLSAVDRVRFSYEFNYTDFGRAHSTSPAFVVPASAQVHSFRVDLQRQHGPWHGELWWSPASRQGWRPWGMNGRSFSARERDFQRYGATLRRAWIFSPSSVASLEAAWMAGHDLDRFSRYTFGAFDNRLRGYPSAAVRYDRGLVVRSMGTRNIGQHVRFDGILDNAWVRDPGFGPRSRIYTGIGLALEGALPFGVLGTLEWGYGVHARRASGGKGTHVIRVAALKVF